MVSELPILTPEKTIVAYRLAGIPVRVMAHLLDLALIAVLVVAVDVVSFALAWIDPGLTMMFAMASSLVFLFGYFVLLEGLWNGRTVGKYAFCLRVRMADGTPVSFPAALGRNLVRFGDFLPAFYFAGFVAIFANPRSQRLGDLVADTVVVHEPRRAPEFIEAPHQRGIHFTEPYLPDLRNMTLEEYQALRRFVDRYPELAQSTQRRLLDEFWQPFADKHRIPPMPGVDPVEVAGGVVMKYGRAKGLL